ncbi:hypothetical protein HHK36_003080 [Tetracentron sinense]|uniref:Hflx-type G domain-containing protein n=1 Tax=Tetracentron sinense TaxID=13715 RepID=A0A834ZMK5_TETSI|nr:hypothetical protein HHK36_003080 [Tetracentron sinense]
MSTCFCSLVYPSTVIQNAKLQWSSHRFQAISLARRKQNPRFIRVFKEGIEVVVSPDDVSLPNPVIDAKEEETIGVSNGVAELRAEETLNSSRGSSNRDTKKREDEKSYDDRFKLRNGREVFEEKAYLIGVERKVDQDGSFGVEESLNELAQLADTAGLMVVASTSQKLANPNPRTYIGSGKVAEIKNAIHALDVETVIFDDELSAGQLRNLEKAFGGDVRVCDRTSLILDIFNQRAATHEAALQANLKLCKSFLIGVLKKELESVRQHRKQYRNRRISVPIPVVSLVGYTNAGKSTLLNQLTGANVLAEDRLFATLDPTTRRVQMKNGKEFLLTDTVGFIQKLPTTLVAAFRATLEEISESSLLVHVVDISHPLAQQQIEAVDKVLSELDVVSIPKLMVWNKVQIDIFFSHSVLKLVDKASDPKKIKMKAEEREDVVCISALTGDGLLEFCDAVQAKLKNSMVWVEALVPFDKGELLNTIHQVGMVEGTIHMAGLGGILRHHLGSTYTAFAKGCPRVEIDIHELKAIIKGLTTTKEFGVANFGPKLIVNGSLIALIVSLNAIGIGQDL